MDPLAHTLAGAALAQTRLGRSTALASPALILGANSCDIDAITMFMSRDLSLGFRRGWTHGVLALVLLPVLLTMLLMLVDRAHGAWRGREPHAQALPLFGITSLAVASHPALDWLNTYGIRLLMPFDGTWYYGDALFIMDPFLWLLLGAPVVVAHSASRTAACAWILLGFATTLLVTGFEGVPTVIRVLWCAGVTVIVWLRLKGRRWSQRGSGLATICLAATAVYIAGMVSTSRIAERKVAAWLVENGKTPVSILASPVAGNPLHRDIVAVDDEHYHFLQVDWLADEPIRAVDSSIARGADGPVVKAALSAPHVRGRATWLRYPFYRVEETPNGFRVSITDLRYARRPGEGLGGVVVELDHNLRPRTP